MPSSARLVAVLGVGVLADPAAPVLPADDLGLTRGDGCFEATRLVVGIDGAHVDHLDMHVARMARSAAALEIEFDEPSWRALLDEVVAAWDVPGEAALRWMLTRGPESSSGSPAGVVTVTPIDEHTVRQRAGVTVHTLPIGRPARAMAGAPWLLGGVKTLSYAVNMSAGREARRRGVDDVLWVSTDGYVLEAPRSAVIWRVGDRLVTTPTDGTGVLASISQAAIFAAAGAAGVETTHELGRPADLLDADGVWLSSSGRLAAPVTELDGVALAVDPVWNGRLRSWFETPLT